MNRLIGTLFALASLAAIAFAILNYGSYTSMCYTPAPTPAVSIVEEEIVEPDSLSTPDPIIEQPVDLTVSEWEEEKAR